MTNSVVFRGPGLFMQGEGTIDHVLLPDARNGGKHVDTSRAKSHHAGLLVQAADRSVRARYSLHDRRVVVRDIGQGGACGFDASFGPERVVPLSRLTNGADASQWPKVIDEQNTPDFWARVAAKVTFDGGDVSGENPSKLVFHFPTDHSGTDPGPRQVPLLAVWRPRSTQGVKIEVKHRNGEVVETVALATGERAWIFNYDKKVPDPKDMENPPDACANNEPGSPLEDHDFKWLFRLLDPPQGNWAKWLKKGDGWFPAPRSRCPGTAAPTSPPKAKAMSPDVASCFFGSWP